MKIKLFIILLILLTFCLQFRILNAANNWAINPITIDTAEDKTGLRNIKFMEWHPAAADNDLLVTDSAGTILWKCRAVAAATNGESYAVEEKEFNLQGVDGIYIATIEGGTLYIFQGK